MPKFRVERTHVRDVAVTFPDGRIIAITDENGEFETELQEALDLFANHPGYSFVKEVHDAAERDTEADSPQLPE